MLTERLTLASARREALVEGLQAEGTDAWRLFHGVAEGRPGLSIDRYGDTLLAQIWFDPPDEAERAAVEEALGPVVWRARGVDLPPTEPTEFREQGLRFGFQAIHDGPDPWLFLDLRPARRWIRAHSAGARVLNTFAYTGGAGLAAAAGGASFVLNLDHATRWTAQGRANALRNGLEMEFLQMDYFAAIRQWAGLPVGGRRGRSRAPSKLQPTSFDLVILDPPTLSRSSWGTVDIVRDYESLFKPAWLCTRPGGALLATHHAPSIDREAWVARCLRCADKAGRPVQDVEHIDVEEDFPSFDGAPPLKMAVFR